MCGLGIRRAGDHCTFLSESDWRSLLASEVPDFRALDGHFVACRWSKGKAEVYSDQLGLRALYVAQAEGGVYFSTREDWIAGRIKDAEVDFGQLGPRWLSFNQFSFESCVRGIQKLGPGGYGILTPRTMRLHALPWRPADAVRGRSPEILPHLRALTNPEMPAGERISLGLSGGLDSRTLLAVLLNRNAAFDVHIFGSDRDPDVRTAREIARAEGLHAVRFDDPVPPVDECIRLMREFGAQAYLCEPVTSALRLGYFDRIRDQNKLMIDGGFGEFLRRQFLSRLLYRGRTALRRLDPAAIARFLGVDRGRIFTGDILKVMEEGVVFQLREALGNMPPISEIGEGNFLDLFTIRHRIPNYGGPEQGRLDSLVVNYMPYAQPSILTLALSIPVPERANGRIFRSLIRDLLPSLARYPLAKAGMTYPFRLGTLQAWLWTKTKSRFTLRYRDSLRDQVLERVKPFVLDSLESQEVRTYGAYDKEYISRVARQYYGGKAELGGTLDWWLTFELWRRSLK